MRILQIIFSYKFLLPLGILIIILYSLQKVNNFISVRGMLKEYIKIFKGSKMQLLFFFGIPILFATSFVQLCFFTDSGFSTLYVVMTMVITMLFSILTVLSGYQNNINDDYKKVLKETKCSIIFELTVVIFIILFAFIFQLCINVLSSNVILVLNWLLYYGIFFALLNLFVIMKRYRILDDFKNNT